MVTRQAPLLDRRGILGIRAHGSYMGGEWVTGAVAQHGIWYALREWDVGIAVEPFGTRQLADVEIITRYRADVIQEALSGEISSQTGRAFIDWYLELDGVRFEILGAEEMPEHGRRRFMKIKGARGA